MRRVVIFLPLIGLLSCKNPAADRVHDVWGYIQERPDSALAVLDDYSIDDFRSSRARAEYALLKSIALDKNYIDLTTDSLIRPALDYYSRRGDAHRRMLCWYYLGCVQSNARDYNAAIVSVTRAEELSEKAGSDYERGLICMSKDHIYHNTYNSTEALVCVKAGIQHFLRAGATRQVVIAESRLALDYIALRRFTEAMEVFDTILENPATDVPLRRETWLAYGRLMAIQEDYGAAMQFFRRALEDGASLDIHSAGRYAFCLFMEGKQDECYSILNQLESIPDARPTLLQQKYLIDKERRDYPRAMEFQRQLIALEDSVAVRTMEQSVVKSQRDYLQQNGELLQVQASRRRLALVLAGMVFILAGAGVLVCIRALLRKHREEKEQMTSELEKARQKFISAYKKQFTRVARLAETYINTSGMSDGRDRVYREVMDLSLFISTDTRTYKKLEKKVNAEVSDVVFWYRKEYPGLDEMKYRFFCYQVAGFPASTIHLLTGISESNVYVKKTRLVETISECPTEHSSLFLLALA
ncbi:MAG: tetratricopeptide repeat protein [Bacteroidales bacterium]|nr:tetratricopeptide repeat protein [Bacteroidales bacterium]